MADTRLWSRNTVRATPRHSPTEYLLRAVLSDTYFRLPTPEIAGARVLDVGCLRANNLLPFHDRGAECYGTEVNQDMVGIASAAAADLDITASIRIGTNTAIPFPDQYFNFILSIVTIHYEESSATVDAGLAEFARVCAPGGCLILSTVAPRHGILKEAQPLGGGRVKLNAAGDWRSGEIFTVFDDVTNLRAAVTRHFGEAETARVTEQYPGYVLDFWVVKALR